MVQRDLSAARREVFLECAAYCARRADELRKRALTDDDEAMFAQYRTTRAAEASFIGNELRRLATGAVGGE